MAKRRNGISDKIRTKKASTKGNRAKDQERIRENEDILRSLKPSKK